MLCFTFLSTSTLAGTDPIDSCQKAHADDPSAHIACLEDALRATTGVKASPEPAAEQPSSLGSEQVEQTQRASGKIADEPAMVLIDSATYNAQELGVFRLDNGQVWQETEKSPKHQRLESGQQYAARIERGKVGGYRMYVDGVRRMLKVKRVN